MRDTAWFQAVLDQMSELVLVKGDKSRLLWANRAFREYYGMTNEELEQLIDAEHSDPDDTVQYVRDDRFVFTTGKTLEVTEPVTRADGEVEYFETIKTPMQSDDDGAVIGTIGVSRPARDAARTAASQQVREERKETLALLDRVVESLPAEVVLLDAQARILGYSPSFAAMFDLEDVRGQFFDGVMGDALPLALIDAGGTQQEPLELAEGELLVEVRVRPWKLPGEQTGGRLVQLVDVTEARRKERELRRLNQALAEAQDALAKSNQELHTLVDTLGAGIIVVDDQAKMKLFNSTAIEILGQGMSDLDQSRWSSTYGLFDEDGELIDVQDLPLSRALRGERVSGHVINVKIPKRSIDRWISVDSQPLEGPDHAAVAVFNDVTKLLEVQKELEEFVHVTSHDLREPVRMVRSFLDLLVEDAQSTLSEDARSYIGFAQEGASRMNRLITDILRYARTRGQNLAFEPVDLNMVLTDVLADLKVQIEEAQGVVEVSNLPTVEGDRSQLRQLFQNLVSNGLKFRHPARPPEVRVRAEGLENRWQLTVEDNGIGIEEAYHEGIFKMFHRLHTRQKYPGMGIGLAVCRRVAHRHGGTIRVASTVGEGSRFSVTLPEKRLP